VSTTKSFAETLAIYFKARPLQWIDGKMLALVAGGYAWRSRVSDIRRAPFGMKIENRQRHVERLAVGDLLGPHAKVAVSEYRYVPPDPPAEPSPAERPHV
jgi:hypothetical protein